MAREETDREDLFAEVAALTPRIELVSTSGSDAVVAGFRADGALSLYFGPDPVVHFNARGQLRRAFRDGRLYKAERGRLVRLTRIRTPEEVVLERHDLSTEEQAKFCGWLIARLADLAENLAGSTYRVARQAPLEEDVIGRMRQWLERYGASPDIADAPGVEAVAPRGAADEDTPLG